MRNRKVAIVFAFLLGTFGVHRFYLGQVFLGVLHCIFFTTGVPTLLGIIDAIVFSGMSDEDFDRKYNKDKYKETTRGEYDKTYSEGRYKGQDVPATYQRENTTVARKTRRRGKTTITNNTNSEAKKAGIKHYRDFNYQEAIVQFEKALESNPSDIALHFNLACAYSLTEEAEKAYNHIHQAVALGFNDIDKISTHEALAYVRIQPQYESFRATKFTQLPVFEKQDKIVVPNPLDDIIVPQLEDYKPEKDLLEELNQLQRLKELGVLTEQEFEEQKQKLKDYR
jgi:TM2 domain-containing membrane protein YozV